MKLARKLFIVTVAIIFTSHSFISYGMQFFNNSLFEDQNGMCFIDENDNAGALNYKFIVTAAAGTLIVMGAVALGKKCYSHMTKLPKEWKNPDEITKQLLDACSDGNLETVKELAKKGVDLNAICNTGNLKKSLFRGTTGYFKQETPLHNASRNGHTNIVDFLLKKGVHRQREAHIERKSTQDQNRSPQVTPLHAAAFNSKNIDVIKLFIENGVNIETRDSHGNTPLRTAAIHGNENLCDYLLQEGANLEEIYKSWGAARRLSNEILTPIRNKYRAIYVPQKKLMSLVENISFKKSAVSLTIEFKSLQDTFADLRTSLIDSQTSLKRSCVHKENIKIANSLVSKSKELVQMSCPIEEAKDDFRKTIKQIKHEIISDAILPYTKQQALPYLFKHKGLITQEVIETVLEQIPFNHAFFNCEKAVKLACKKNIKDSSGKNIFDACILFCQKPEIISLVLSNHFNINQTRYENFIEFVKGEKTIDELEHLPFTKRRNKPFYKKLLNKYLLVHILSSIEIIPIEIANKIASFWNFSKK